MSTSMSTAALGETVRREALSDLDRQLDDVRVAEAAGDGEQLEIEGEAVLLEDREQLGDDLSPGELDPALGVWIRPTRTAPA